MTAPMQESDLAVDVILRDGATLRLRAPVEGDVPALVEFFAALSVQAASSASMASRSQASGSHAPSSSPTGPSGAR